MTAGPIKDVAAEASYLRGRLSEAEANAAHFHGIAQAEHAHRIAAEHELAAMRDRLAAAPSIEALEDIGVNVANLARAIADDLDLPVAPPDENASAAL